MDKVTMVQRVNSIGTAINKAMSELLPAADIANQLEDEVEFDHVKLFRALSKLYAIIFVHFKEPTKDTHWTACMALQQIGEVMGKLHFTSPNARAQMAPYLKRLDAIENAFNRALTGFYKGQRLSK